MLWLHREANGVYFSRNGVNIEHYAGSLSDLTGIPYWDKAQTLCLVGSAFNAPLIVEAWKQHEPDRQQVQLVTPVIYEPSRIRHHAACALQAMPQFIAASSQGGPHNMLPRELPVYEIASLLLANEEIPMNLVTELCSSWPRLWRCWQLLPNACPKVLAKLMGIIRDPRWYIDIRRPNSFNRLFDYLCLDRRRVARLQKREARVRTHLQAVIDGWYSPEKAQHFIAHPEELSTPGNFVWRSWYKYEVQNQPIVGLVEATRQFVQFLVLAWRAEIYAGQYELLPALRVILSHTDWSRLQEVLSMPT